jgi:superfamily II DNA or RNA helicase
MFDPFACATSLKENLLSYMSSSLPIGNHPSQISLGEEFYEQWSKELFKGPFVEALPKYETVPALSAKHKQLTAKIADGSFWSLMSQSAKLNWEHIDSKHVAFLKTRDRLWSRYPQEQEAEATQTSVQRLWNQPLYRHQWEALRLICNDHRSIVVTTGTGSGKTECYLLPLLHLLMSEAPSERAAPGVRAIVLFPMNALVEDQMRRLRKLFFWINLASLNEPGDSRAHLKRQITFGRYTGDTPVNESDSNREKPSDHIEELGERLTRSQMRLEPPDILVTNFSMLEYALLRSDDQVLFQNARLFKMLVLDEVHTYSGTVGAEVAMLLRRLRAFLCERAGAGLPFPICVGTSATVGSGQQAASEMATFASSLFGCPIQSDQILLGKLNRVATSSGSLSHERRRELADGLSKFVSKRPLLIKLIGGHLRVNDELDWEARLGSEIEEFAVLVDGCWENMDAEIRNLDLLSADPEFRARALLGLIIRNSSAVHLLVDLLQASDRSCSDLAELSAEFFPSYSTDDENRTAAQTALSLLLIVLANATIDGRAFFPIRFHHFVSEKREGFACINGACRDLGISHSKTDGWWSRLFLQHHRNCSVCQSIVYPIFVCRKCGFVYLQAWRRPDAICLPEKDDLESRSCRFLFRPVTELSYSVEDLAARKRALCLSCGHWFESADTVYGKEAQASHGTRCQTPRIIEIFEWSEDQSDYEMSECAVCEQNWYAGREVVTAPTISPFAAATLFIEELVSNSSAPAHLSKLIAFSDTRQQAAKLAAKLQRTNRDFVFRQLLFQLIATAGRALTAIELFQELFKEIRNDDRTRQLLIDSPQSLHDDLALEQILADLTFRELTSAYHTLESLGLVRIDYGPKVLSAVAGGLVIPGSWRDSLNADAKQDLLRLTLDWGFRFRHCVDSAANKLPIRMAVLQQWKIFAKRVPGPRFGKKSQMEAVLFLDRAEVRNPLFNFMSRLWDRSKSRGRLGALDKSEFNALMLSIWQLFFGDNELLTVGRTSTEANREFVAFRASEPDFGALQLNINSLRLAATDPSDVAFQCDVCGRLNHYTVGNVCPVRKCQGILRAISQSEIEKRFAPTRHYRRLIRERELRPLRVEEHTAEIANTKRLDIERRFRGDDDESVDVISGSTTFELGVDLGSISTVFLANLPPRLSNYRQRAGRAGRREGMVPFVLSYVRERPHDQYFWRDLKSFISGPIPTPKFKLASEEVLKRHGFSVVLSFALSEYQNAGGIAGKLWGPLWKNLAPFLFDQKNRTMLQKRAAETGGDIAKSLRVLYDGIEEPLRSKLKAIAVHDAFYERLKRMEPVMAARGDEGCIKVLGDYGILPTYAFPIYVDELRLNAISPDRPPRCDLQLTRDRRISLVEYYPGRTITAGKLQIQSNGIWDGFDAKAFKRCSGCAQLFFNPNASNACIYCGKTCDSLTAVIPWGGYYGSVVNEGAPPEVDYDELFSSEVVFDPANDPRPEFRPVGRYLSVATVDANVMQTARMRQFSPRPGSKNPLQLERRNDMRDVAAPHTPVVCLALGSGQPGSVSQPYYLLHEFSTDIVRLHLAAGSHGQVIQSSSKLAQALVENSLNNQKRQWLKQNFWLTLGESLLIASARYLDIDETGSAELGITFRDEMSDACLDNRELILFDTAPGGAGYVREIATHLKEVTTLAAAILSQCACGDSCYRCLRSYRNQWIHSRLDRHFVSEGLTAFLNLNWS